jgi:hypothetical protein
MFAMVNAELFSIYICFMTPYTLTTNTPIPPLILVLIFLLEPCHAMEVQVVNQ